MESRDARRIVGVDTATPVVTERVANLSDRRVRGGSGGETNEIAELGEIVGGEFGGDAAADADVAVPTAGPRPDSLGTSKVLLEHPDREPSPGPDL
jgi:hypothetical protein